MNALELKNLTENREHELTVGVTTVEGKRNSTTFSWFIGMQFPRLFDLHLKVVRLSMLLCSFT